MRFPGNSYWLWVYAEAPAGQSNERRTEEIKSDTRNHSHTII